MHWEQTTCKEIELNIDVTIEKIHLTCIVLFDSTDLLYYTKFQMKSLEIKELKDGRVQNDILWRIKDG